MVNCCLGWFGIKGIREYDFVGYLEIPFLAPSPKPPLDRVKFPQNLEWCQWEPNGSWPFLEFFTGAGCGFCANTTSAQARSGTHLCGWRCCSMGCREALVSLWELLGRCHHWWRERVRKTRFASSVPIFFEENMAGENTGKHISNWRMWILIIIQFVGVKRYNLPECLLATVITLVTAMGHWSRWGFPSHTSDLGVETEMLWFQGSRLLDPSSLIVDPSFLDELWMIQLYSLWTCEWLVCFRDVFFFKKKSLAASLEKLHDFHGCFP